MDAEQGAHEHYSGKREVPQRIGNSAEGMALGGVAWVLPGSEDADGDPVGVVGGGVGHLPVGQGLDERAQPVLSGVYIFGAAVWVILMLYLIELCWRSWRYCSTWVRAYAWCLPVILILSSKRIGMSFWSGELSWTRLNYTLPY